MAESGPAVQAGLDALQDSAPLRDFSRPSAGHEPASVPLPGSGPGGSLLLPRLQGLPTRTLAGTFTAAVMVLLARHSRRTEIGLTALLPDAAAAPVRLLADLPAQRRFAELARVLEAALVPSGTTDVGAAASPGDVPFQLPGVVVSIVEGPPSRPPPHVSGDLAVRIARDATGLHARIDFDGLLYRQDSIVPLARQLAHLLATVGPDTNQPVGELPLFDDTERRRLIHGFNDLRAPYPLDRTIAQLIEAQAAQTPDTVCAVHGDRSLQFGELDDAASRLAGLLVALGIGRGSFVAIVDYRGLDFVVAMLAIWKAGGAYIPVDPSYPEERVRYMLADSEVSVAIAGPAAVTRFAHVLADSPRLRDVVCPGRGADASAATAATWRLHGPEALQAVPALTPGRRATAADAAYMIYTSGSTGRPKGAIVRHDGAVNHLFAQAGALGREAVSRFMQSAPSSSDISVWQFAAPLVFGGTTVIVDDATDVENLHEQVRRHGLQIIELVPAVLKYLVEYASALPPRERALPSLRWAMVTGESASVELVNAWLAVYPHIPVVNAYGPTEAADDVCQAIVREPLPAHQLTVPIGRPLANIDLYVLDDALQPVPVGAPGEICVAGIGVGDGYWKQPEKTRQSFVPNPFPGTAGAVIYRTGDLGRLRDDGTLECLGRLDHQVQLRGFRIELQEIESVLRGHPAVSDAVVQAFHDGRGDGQLVAFVVLRTAQAAQDEALRAHMATRLPPYMVPSAIERLTSLPLNPAGKVDRKALQPPAPAGRRVQTPYRAPRTPREHALAQIWHQELGSDRVGVDDDFFALGGDSLAALAIAVAARDAGLHLRSAQVLQHPTVARLATVAGALPAPRGEGSGGAAPLRPLLPFDEAERTAFLASRPEFEDVQPLAPPQQGLFVHALLTRDKTAYIDQYCYRLEGPLDLPAFEEAWNRLIARHSLLRTAMLRSGLRRPAQAICREARVSVELVDHSTIDEAARAAPLAGLLASEIARGFDLAHPPLMRLVLVRAGPQSHHLVWTHHHIVLDGWSLSLALQEVLRTHAALSAGLPPDLATVVPYQRYIDWLASQDIAPAEPFWQRTLAGYAGAPALHLGVQSERGPGFAQLERELDCATTEALVRRARSAGVTLTTLLQAAWAAMLGRLSTSDDVVFGIVTSGREIDLPCVDAIMGLLVTTLPLRVDVATAAAGSLDDWLADIQACAAEIREHEAVPLAQVARWCGLAPGRTLFETLFVMSNYPEVDVDSSGPLRVTPAQFRTVPAYPLSVVAVPGSRLLVRVIHDRQRIDNAAAESIADDYAGMLAGLSQGLDPRSKTEADGLRPQTRGHQAIGP